MSSGVPIRTGSRVVANHAVGFDPRPGRLWWVPAYSGDCGELRLVLSVVATATCAVLALSMWKKPAALSGAGVLAIDALTKRADEHDDYSKHFSTLNLAARSSIRS